MADLASVVFNRIQAWNAAHPPAQHLDPAAVLAVAKTEGLSGGIGDNGHAFGFAQLNNAGGVITGKFRGQTPAQINKWAWSPAGIDYALAGIARVAGGLKGTPAVTSIVNGFERPANPGREIAAATGGLSGVTLPTQTPVAPTASAPAQGGGVAALLAGLTQAVNIPSLRAAPRPVPKQVQPLTLPTFDLPQPDPLPVAAPVAAPQIALPTAPTQDGPDLAALASQLRAAAAQTTFR